MFLTRTAMLWPKSDGPYGCAFAFTLLIALQSQGRGHPGQQPKLQQQPQHVVKASQGPVQV